MHTDRIRIVFPKTTTAPLLDSSRSTANVPHARGSTTDVVCFEVVRCFLGDVTSSHQSEDVNSHLNLHDRIDPTPSVNLPFHRNVGCPCSPNGSRDLQAVISVGVRSKVFTHPTCRPRGWTCATALSELNPIVASDPRFPVETVNFL